MTQSEIKTHCFPLFLAIQPKDQFGLAAPDPDYPTSSPLISIHKLLSKITDNIEYLYNFKSTHAHVCLLHNFLSFEIVTLKFSQECDVSNKILISF
jgi:hypothetical protein